MNQNIKFRKINFNTELLEEGKISKFDIKPLERGFGITLGTALRRVLLSSIPGTAIISIEIDGVQHEFSTISGVREDVVGIVLNLKQVVFKTPNPSDEYSEIIELDVSDKTEVTAGDFILPDGLEIVNKDQHICTLSQGTNFKMRAEVRCGVGYASNSENRMFAERIGQIPIDSLFSPVQRVTFNVEKLQGDLDELILEIETNGAISANDALGHAAEILIEHFEQVKKISAEVPIGIFDDSVESVEEVEIDIPIDRLDLNVRTFNALARSGIKTIDQLLQLKKEDVMKIRSLGRKSYKELIEKLEENGYKLQGHDIEEDDFEDEEEIVEEGDDI